MCKLFKAKAKAKAKASCAMLALVASLTACGPGKAALQYGEEAIRLGTGAIQKFLNSTPEDKLVAKAACQAFRLGLNTTLDHDEWTNRILTNVPVDQRDQVLVEKAAERLATDLAGLNLGGGASQVYARACYPSK